MQYLQWFEDIYIVKHQFRDITKKVEILDFTGFYRSRYRSVFVFFSWYVDGIDGTLAALLRKIQNVNIPPYANKNTKYGIYKGNEYNI